MLPCQDRVAPDAPQTDRLSLPNALPGPSCLVNACTSHKTFSHTLFSRTASWSPSVCQAAPQEMRNSIFFLLGTKRVPHKFHEETVHRNECVYRGRWYGGSLVDRQTDRATSFSQQCKWPLRQKTGHQLKSANPQTSEMGALGAPIYPGTLCPRASWHGKTQVLN